jgi:ankyrin repeat protein
MAITGTITSAERPAPSISEAGEHSAGRAEKRLWEALREGNLPLLKAAVAARADVNCRTPAQGLPPLLELLRSGTVPLGGEQRECVGFLLAHGAQVNVADGDRRTPIIYAARSGDLETLRLLVEAEAYVRTRDRFHKTALFYAVEADRRDIVVYLAQNGALISLSVKERRRMGQG